MLLNVQLHRFKTLQIADGTKRCEVFLPQMNPQHLIFNVLNKSFLELRKSRQSSLLLQTQE